MQLDVIAYDNIQVILEQRPSKSLRKFGNGRLSIFLDNKPVWRTEKKGKEQGVEWTWCELLSFLTSNWAWLLNEQGLPLPIKFPDVLSGTAAELRDKLAHDNNIVFSNEQTRTLRQFCLRHDLAESVPGIVLPSLFILRMGEYMLFSSEHTQVITSIINGKNILERIGDIIYNWMQPYADDETQLLLDAWRRRDNSVKDIISTREHLLARMDKESFHDLSKSINYSWNNSWDGPVMRESEMFAAARMSSGFVQLTHQIDILNAISNCPPLDIDKFNKISHALYIKHMYTDIYSKNTTPYLQGYALARSLRKHLHKKEDEPLDPESFLKRNHIRIQEMKWEDSPLEALSCWSNSHGPLILINIADGKRCSHEYGRRFTLGHELCHLLADRSHALGLVDVLGGGMPDFMERRANAFSAEILLPQQLAIKELQESEEEPEIFLLRLREKYKVSCKMAASQIYNSYIYNYIDEEKALFFANEVHNQHDEYR